MIGTLVSAIWNSKRGNGDATNDVCRLRKDVYEALYVITN